MNSSTETMYSAYGNVGFCWPLVVCAVLINAIAIPGIFLNFTVIWVTFKTKSLHGTANYLLALCSFYELLHELGLLLFLYVALSGLNFIPYGLALRICTLTLFGTCAVAPTMAFTGLDRLLIIMYPTFPKWVKMRFYLGSITLICSTLSALQIYNLYNNSVSYDMMISGYRPDIAQAGNAGKIYSTATFIIYNVTIGIYLIVGIVLKCKAVPSNGNNDVERRIFRSLMIIIICNVGGYYLMRMYSLFIAPLIGSPVTAWFGTYIVGIPANLSSVSNAPILYFTSKEYRNAFRRQFYYTIGKYLNVSMANIQPTTQLAARVAPATKNMANKNGTTGTGNEQLFHTRHVLSARQ